MRIGNFSIYLDVRNLKKINRKNRTRKKGSLKLSYEKLEAKNSLLVKRLNYNYVSFCRNYISR
jgi:hypothetical protein